MKHVKLFESFNREALSKILIGNITDWTMSEINDLKMLGAESITKNTCVFNEANDLVVNVTKGSEVHGALILKAKSNKESSMSHEGRLRMIHMNQIQSNNWSKFLLELDEFIQNGGISVTNLPRGGFDL